MGVKDTVTAKYMRQNNVFADAFNYFVYNGRQVIDSKVWDGPMSIHEMFNESDSQILALVPDYKINLIAPASIEDSDFEKFSSTLREVLSFIKYSRDAKKLEETINSNEEFRHLGRTEVDVLNACVSANLTMKQDEEVLDVCLAIQTIADNAADKRQIETLLQSIKNLMQTMGWTAEQTMDNMKVSEADRKALAPFL